LKEKVTLWAVGKAHREASEPPDVLREHTPPQAPAEGSLEALLCFLRREALEGGLKHRQGRKAPIGGLKRITVPLRPTEPIAARALKCIKTPRHRERWRDEVGREQGVGATMRHTLTEPFIDPLLVA
jgi:hypothetical protein